MSVRQPHFDVARELAEQSPDDYQFGAVPAPNLYSLPEAFRNGHLPPGELQFAVEDFQDCASRSPDNAFEAYFTYAYHEKLLKPENVKWLEANGYVQGFNVTFSDRFTAILSGTTRQGNSLKAPLDCIHRYGLIPKMMLPKPEGATWDEYHNPSKITEEMRALGREFAARFSLNYDKVYAADFPKALENDILCVAGFAWPSPVNGEYGPSNNPPNHAFMLYKNQYYAFDNYIDETDGDFIKKLAPNFVFFDYGYRAYVSREVTKAELQEQISTLKWFIEYLKGLIAKRVAAWRS